MQPLALDSIKFVGSGLTRPECVLTTARGDIFTSHFGGGVTHIAPDGHQRDILGDGEVRVATNGFALTGDGDFLCANLLPPGGVWRIDRDGRQTPFVTEVDGVPLVSVNFVHADAEGRVWITISTRENPRSLGYRADVASGFIVLVDARGARVVADGIGYTNEAKVDPSGRWLVVNETFSRRTSRFRIGAGNVLGARQTITEYGAGVFPDGLDFDAEGNIWMTSVVSNRLVRIAMDGSQTLVLEDADEAELAVVERAYQAGELGREHLDAIGARTLKSLSSVTFGGAGLTTLYLGNLLDERIYAFASPVAGHPPPYWHVEF